MVMLRHTRKPRNISPLIDQACTYFLDARKANWRTGGLLYYYSFLNLSKAFLVLKKVFSFKKIVTASILHGLRAPVQSAVTIPDYELEIHPPSTKRGENVFSHMYQALTSTKWPHRSSIRISLKEVLGHCNDISDELHKLHKITPDVFRTQSLLRLNNQECWFEMLADKTNAQRMLSSPLGSFLSIVDRRRVTDFDRQDWLDSFRVNAILLGRNSIVRGKAIAYTQSTRATAMKQVRSDAARELSDYAIPTVYDSVADHYWLFTFPVELAGSTIRWHPLLSDYLFSFALSSILRYQPYNLDARSKDYLIAQFWCNQSATSVLRYFF